MYYYTGYWYGRKGNMNAYAQYKEFLSTDIIHVYFDVEQQKVSYSNCQLCLQNVHFSDESEPARHKISP